ncbi:MAG: hypothetical protein V3W37_06180, partial [Candidatus Binatia bacterium]
KSLSEPIREQLLVDILDYLSQRHHAYVDYHYGEYGVVFPQDSSRNFPSTTGATSTREVIFNWKIRDWMRFTHDDHIGAISDVQRSDVPIPLFNSQWETISDGRHLVGMPSRDITNTVAQALIYNILDDYVPNAVDSVPANALKAIILGSEDLDAGHPGRDKLWAYLQLWLDQGFMKSNSNTNTFKIAFSTNEGASYTTDLSLQLQKGVEFIGANHQIIIQFNLDYVRAEKLRIRITIDTEEWGFLLNEIRHMALWYELAGRVESRQEGQVYELP